MQDCIALQNTQDLDPESLRCFLAAAKRESFRAAARSVGLSPAAFGVRIAALETALRVPLFERSTRRIALTTEGRALMPQAERCLAEHLRCFEVVRDGGRAPATLKIGTRFELGLSFIVPALDALERDGRRIDLYFGDTGDLTPRLMSGVVDAVVTSARVAEPRLEQVRLHQETYAFVAAPALLQKRPLRNAQEAREHVLLDISADLPLLRYLLDGRPSHERWSFGSVRYLGTIGAVRARVLSGAGVAVLPRYFIRDDLRARRMQTLLPRTALSSDWFRLVFRHDHERADVLRELAAELAKRPLS